MNWKEKMNTYIKSPWLGLLTSIIIVFLSNYYLQLSQNSWSFRLATKFAFSWHTEKFLLGVLVLLVLNLFIVSLAGSFPVGNLFYGIGMILLGIANGVKMAYRVEPIYPDDLKMIVQWSMLKDILGGFLFSLALCLVVILILALGYSFYRALKLPIKWQKIRVVTLVITTFLLFYISEFNQSNNLLRKAYDRTALWIPYSQKMNYYNTGFMGGFLFNLKVDGMDKPEGYSQESIDTIVAEYNKKANQINDDKEKEEQPNIIYIMSESFSDPLKLSGMSLSPDPLVDYREVANESTYSGQMLSQNYGGGTANIEFEALTGFSMGLLNPQMTTPYTMMLPKETEFPSMVSTLKSQNYEATAIHPYNTSMYKRKTVYDVLGFDEFLDEKTMTHQTKLSENGFISDESAFSEVLDVLDQGDDPHFIHLVTMQTHMPYNNKYETSDYTVTGTTKQDSIENYAQDIAYTSEALKKFMEETQKLERPTVIVFWGDHLPSIYPEEVIEANNDVTTHLTEYFVYDSREKAPTMNRTVSPFYFPTLVSQSQGVKTTGFFELLNEVHAFLPAFEKDSYFYNQTWQKELDLTDEQQLIFNHYKLIQYDMVSGEKYSTKLFE